MKNLSDEPTNLQQVLLLLFNDFYQEEDLPFGYLREIEPQEVLWVSFPNIYDVNSHQCIQSITLAVTVDGDGYITPVHRNPHNDALVWTHGDVYRLVDSKLHHIDECFALKLRSADRRDLFGKYVS